jgi:hypothetical protein
MITLQGIKLDNTPSKVIQMEITDHVYETD